MKRDKVKIFDTTLRDGLRNSGATLSLEQKVRVAQQLEQLDVDAIEIGFGGPLEIESMRSIAEAVTGPVVFGLSRVNRKDMERVFQGVAQARKPGINIFIPTSDSFLTKVRMSRQQALDTAVSAVGYAKERLDHIAFSAQDASRSDPDYLVQIFGEVIRAGATTVSVPDSTGQALPRQFGALYKFLRKHVANAKTVTWSVHCHNELGLAVANSLAAIENGARQVECTINGIGERAGNTSLEEVVMALRTREDAFTKVTTGIVAEQLYATSQLLSQMTNITVSINKPVVGANVLRH